MDDSHLQHGDNAYNNVHRALLQALLTRQTFTFDSVRPLLANILKVHDETRATLTADITRDEFESYIHTLNAAISAFDLEIRSSTHQLNNTRIYALVNTTSDVFTQIATARTADEIAFVKRLLDNMFEVNNTRESEVMAITSMQALRLAKAPTGLALNGHAEGATQATVTGLTMAQAEHVLHQMVLGGWFEQSAASYYSLSPRALMELRGWLLDTYNDDQSQADLVGDDTVTKIKTCLACKEIVTIGQRCSDLDCSARVHLHCKCNIFRAQQNKEICPLCRRTWEQAKPVGEKAARVHGNNGRSANPNPSLSDSGSDSE